jgi:hypothetical protein
MAQFRSIARWGLSVVLLSGTALVCAQDESAGARYAKVLADTQSLERYNEQLSGQLTSQQEQAVQMEKQLAEMDATGAQIPSLIQKMFDSLEAFVATDLPFLDPTQAGPDSRQERLARLRELMAEDNTPDTAASTTEPDDNAGDGDPGAADSGETAADADQLTADSDETASDEKQREILAKQHAKNAERYRRLLEAYQIELDYGRTLFAYTGNLPDGREADFVRVGRISLMYRTSDGEEAGYWDAEQKQWVAANEYNKAIENAVLMATKELAPELMMIPVPAPQEVPL